MPISKLFISKSARSTTALVIIGLGILITLAFINKQSQAQFPTISAPNIIILSVDSLRPDITNPVSPNSSPAPFISKKLGLSHNFTQAYTPLARTFPAWMSVLTGKLPIHHKAEFNLTSPKRFKDETTFAHILQNNNYHTVYASDEKRFANITHDLGFSEVLGPPYGLADFLLGTFSDLPLLNIATLFPQAEKILPYSTHNRAAHKSYDPNNFSQYLIKQLKSSAIKADGKPLFIAIHLCLPHHPFSWRDSTLANSNTEGGMEENYRNTVTQADQQIATIYNALESFNIINKQSTQVFMSDHGESLPSDEKHFIKPNGSAQRISSLGHGTNALQIKQHHVVMAIQNPSLLPKTDPQLVSLIDIMPTLLAQKPKLTHLPLKMNIDGINILQQPQPTKRWLSLETGYNVHALNNAQLNESEVFKQAAHAYRITAAGKVVIKDSIYQTLRQDKQYAWWNGSELITHQQGAFINFNWHNFTVAPYRENILFKKGLNYP